MVPVVCRAVRRARTFPTASLLRRPAVHTCRQVLARSASSATVFDEEYDYVVVGAGAYLQHILLKLISMARRVRQ
jgi:hypothetical protein